MNIGEQVEYWGNKYTAVPYSESDTVDFFPVEDDDKQCRICALEPNYCKMKDYCHGEQPFVFVKSQYIQAMTLTEIFR